MSEEDRRIAFACEPATVRIAISQIVPLRVMRAGTKESNKYKQILASVRIVGLVEPPVVIPDADCPGQYLLQDGHLRIEALKDLGAADVACLVATGDDTYTYNKRINRLPPIQEHRMIQRAIDRGVPEARIAEALRLDVQSVRKRRRLLEGICDDAATILQDAPCPAAVFDIIRRMAPVRQVEAADLMNGQKTFTTKFATAILAATPDAMLVDPRKRKPDRKISAEQIDRMERELARLQLLVKGVEETYGVDNLHLTVARGYLRKLLGNVRIVRWLSQHRQEYLTEFHAILELESLVPTPTAAE